MAEWVAERWGHPVFHCPYLEAAPSTMFIDPVLKPVAAFGSHVGELERIPGFHVHSDVPFPARESERREGKAV